MKVFSIKGSKEEFILTRENYIQQTQKKYPYYQSPENGKNSYYAICPLCHNPIQIINLFGRQYQEKYTGKVSLHGRHCRKSIPDLAQYSQENYDCCPLHHPRAFGIEEIRNNEKINEEIRQIIVSNRIQICRDIREITGVLLTNSNISQIIDNYLAAGEYRYAHTHQYNIPYSILYTREAISIFGQKLWDSQMGEQIKQAIANNSNYFSVEDDRIKKNTDKYVDIYLLVCNHVINRDDQYITLRVMESHHDNVHVIIEIKIKMKIYLYKRY